MAGRWPQKQPAFAQAARKPRLPAFGADALMYRRQGMAVTALIVGLDHFNAGRAWTTLRNTLRVVVPADVRDVTSMDWTVAAGLDVVVDHWAPVDAALSLPDARAARRAARRRADELLYTLQSANAQSVWWAFEADGLECAQRVETRRYVGADNSLHYSTTAAGSIVRLPDLPAALEALHDMQLVCGEGLFGTQAAVPARLARLNEVFGGDLALVAQALGVGVDARAAA